MLCLCVILISLCHISVNGICNDSSITSESYILLVAVINMLLSAAGEECIRVHHRTPAHKYWQSNQMDTFVFSTVHTQSLITVIQLTYICHLSTKNLEFYRKLSFRYLFDNS